jgi:hypothetical protein
VSGGYPPAPGEPISEETKNIAKAIGEISDRATLLVREEIELAKAEMSQKAVKLAQGAIVGVVAGVFFVTALMFVLVGCAYLLYYYLPIGNENTFFYGFFAMAVILVVLGSIAGLLAARAVKKGSPPVPNMAIDEARKIRESVGPAPAGVPAASAARETAVPFPASGPSVGGES